ncbi:14-3-3-like protein A [Tanacetum coccineum]
MEKLSEEVKLFQDMVEFMDRIYISNDQVTIDDRKALSVARDNVNSVHREMSAVILSSSLAIDVSLIVRDYRSKVGKELNDICNKVSNLTIKVNVKDYVDSIQHDYDFCIDDDDDVGEINPYLEKKKKLMLESKDYRQTLLFLDKLKVIAGQEQVSSKDLGILFHAYNMIMGVHRGLYKIIDSVESSSVWDIDVSLTINESRTKVQNELNYICNNMTNHTIKEAISHHLVGYKAGHRPTKLLPRVNFLTSNSISVLLLLCVLIDIARILQRGKECQANQMETINKKSKLGSGDGEFWSDADPGFDYHDHSKRIKKREDVYSQINAIFRDCDLIHGGNGIGNIQADDILEDDFLLYWDPECLEKGVDVQHDFTVDDSSEGSKYDDGGDGGATLQIEKECQASQVVSNPESIPSKLYAFHFGTLNAQEKEKVPDIKKRTKIKTKLNKSEHGIKKSTGRQSCGNGAHIGYNCPPKALIISNPEPCNQTIDELPQTLPSVHPTSCSRDENSFTYDSKPNSVDNSLNVFDPPPQPPMNSSEFCGNDARYGHYCTPQVLRKKKGQLWKSKRLKIDIGRFLFATMMMTTYSFATQEYLKKFSSAITLDLPKSDSLIMEDKHLDTIPATKSDEVIKFSVEKLVQIPNHYEILSDSNDDGTSSDDDDFKDIEYVSLVEVDDVDQDKEEFDLEDILQIQDVILREKLLNISHLITNIESLNDNPTPDRMLKSPALVPISVTDSNSFFEKSDTSLSHLDKSLPEFESFNDDTEETRSGSTTTHANNSLPEYDSIKPDQGELTNVVIEEVDTFLVPEDSIPPGIKSNFNPGGGEIDFSQNVKDDDTFTFVIRTFLSFLTYPADSPLLLSTGSEDTIFDPGIST